MTVRRKVLLSVVLVVMGWPELGLGQFQQQFMQPTRPQGRGRRLSAAVPARVYLPASCLEYGVKTPEPTDVFAGVTPGRAFLVGHLPGGGSERLDLDEAVRRGVVVLRGTGKTDEVLAEVLAPGWSELEILPGCAALPPRARPLEVPRESLALVEEAAAVEEGAAKLPGAGGHAVERVLSGARQEHLWAIRSASWQALTSGSDPLQTAIGQVRGLKDDPAAAARIAWASRDNDHARGHKLDLGFLGEFAVLRLAGGAARGPASFEVCTTQGVKNAALTRAGVQGLAETLKARSAGNVVLTSELLAAVEQARLTNVLDDVLAVAGHTFIWRVQDDYLAVQSFAADTGARRRFAVIAPQTAAEAKAIFGRNNRAAFAFKGLIEEKLVERVKTIDELTQLATGAREGERLVLVCVERYGRIPALDGSEIAVSELPAGIDEVLAIDTFDPAEKPPVEAIRAGALTFDALATGVRSAVTVGAVGPLTRTELIEALSVGIQGEWKKQRIAAGPVMRWGRMVNGDAVVVGAGGTMMKVTTRSTQQAQAARRSE